ncbi:conjugation system SOS inhibitor PsiB family protein [Serratia sp. CY56810]
MQIRRLTCYSRWEKACRRQQCGRLPVQLRQTAPQRLTLHCCSAQQARRWHTSLVQDIGRSWTNMMWRKQS